MTQLIPHPNRTRHCVTTSAAAARSSVTPLLIACCVALQAVACGESQTSAPGAALAPASSPTPTAIPTPSVPALLPLHATRGEQPGIFDSAGRQVLLRGVNLNALGDYYQPNPAYPPVIALRDSDFPEMARQGFNVVRLILSWSFLEPSSGQISAEYLQRIHAAVDAAKANGIYVVLDMHQDAWGKYIATPPGVTCPPSLERAVGWDGAPEWATLTDGKSTCRAPGVRELSAAVKQAFANFYTDRDGIQTHLIDAWAALVSEFAREPAVAGYDLINEPHFGNNLVNPAPQLAAFYTRLVPAMRSAEQQAGGPSHIIFFEPIPTWPAGGTTPATDFTADENIVFAPHNYIESLTSFGNAQTIEDGFAIAARDAANYGTTFWIGEYGWFGDPPANKAKVIRYARAEDQMLVGGVWWQWHQACGDPHSIGMDGGQPPAELIHFNRTLCPGDVDGGPVPEWAVVLSRPYPRAAPGHLVSLQSDGDATTLELSGVADATSPGATLDLWVPDRGAGQPVIGGTGIGATRVIDVPGGFRVLVDVAANYQISARLETKITADYAD